MLTEPAMRPPMAFLAVSYSDPSAAMKDGRNGEQRVRKAATLLTDNAPIWLGGGRTCIWLAGAEVHDINSKSYKRSTLLLTQVSRSIVNLDQLSSCMPEGAEESIWLARAEAILCKMTPPFAIVSFGERPRSLRLLTFSGISTFTGIRGTVGPQCPRLVSRLRAALARC